MVTAGALHTGCPHPDALTPIITPVAGVMS
jgi:hypothetical protein